MQVKTTRKLPSKGTRDKGGCELSSEGKLRTYQKHDREPGPVKVFTKEEIAEYQKTAPGPSQPTATPEQIEKLRKAAVVKKFFNKRFYKTTNH